MSRTRDKRYVEPPRFDPEGWGATDRWWYAQEKTQTRSSSTVFLQSKSGTTYQKMVPRDLKTLRELIDALVTTAVAQREKSVFAYRNK